MGTQTLSSCSWPQIDFLVLGAQKCATSWLYYCLREHPELHLPPKKREVEYLGGELYQERGAEWYFSLLSGGSSGQKVGDVSIEYLFDIRSPELVKEYAPETKLILSLRDPVDRFISAFTWYVRTRRVDQGTTVDQAVSFALEETHPEAPGSGGGSDPFKDMLERGKYDVQVDRYRRHFRDERFFVLLYEDIKNDPRDALRRLYTFLDVDPDFLPQSFHQKPKQSTHHSGLITLERLAQGNRIATGILNRFNQLMNSFGFGGARPDLSSDGGEELRSVFSGHILRTGEFIDSLPPCQKTSDDSVVLRWTDRGRK